MRFTRRNLLITGVVVTAMAVTAWATEQHVINFAAPAAVTAGESIGVSVAVNQSNMAVRVTSNPPGLVDQVLTVSGGAGSFVVGTNSGAPQGNYLLVATPVGGGVAKTCPIVAMPPL